MSFGFAVGDFISAICLVKDIVSSLRTASVSEYRELIVELQCLQRALHEIEHLSCSPDQEPAINSMKLAALMCQYPLNEFAGKLQKFESLDFGQRQSRAKMWSRKLKWGFTMEEEVRNLRAYLVAHVGSLNMRLLTQGLVNASCASTRTAQFQADVVHGFESSQEAIDNVYDSVRSSADIAGNHSIILQKLSNVVSIDIVSQLKNLIDLATKVWNLNTQIMNSLVKLQTSPSPHLQHTWFQEPVRFEDALGRVIPIPSEYNWGKLEAIIQDQFNQGPASNKVLTGEYELFNTNNSAEIISQSNFESLTPGMSITMAIIIGQYEGGSLARCPRPGCPAKESASLQAGGRLCPLCRLRFDASRRPLPYPLRTITAQFQQPEIRYQTSSVPKRKRENDVQEDTATSSFHDHKRIRTERQKIKNVRIHQTPLPVSPPVVNVRQRHTSQWNFLRERKRQRWLPSQKTEGQTSPTSPCPAPRSCSPGSRAAPSLSHSNPVDLTLRLMKYSQRQAPHALNPFAQPFIPDWSAHEPGPEQICLSDLPKYQYFPKGAPLEVGSSVGFSAVPVFSDPGTLPRAYDPDFGLSTRSLPASLNKVYAIPLSEVFPSNLKRVGFPFPGVDGDTFKWLQLALER